MPTKELDNNNHSHPSSSHVVPSADSDGFDDSTDTWPVICNPFVNVDGTPMLGDVDIYGNPYGVTSAQAFVHNSIFSDDTPPSSLFDDDWLSDKSNCVS